MGYRVDTETVLKWDSEINQMVKKIEVVVCIVGNLGTIFVESEPLYCSTPSEVLEAIEILKERAFKTLSGSEVDNQKEE